jgi:hypothetical protein
MIICSQLSNSLDETEELTHYRFTSSQPKRSLKSATYIVRTGCTVLENNFHFGSWNKQSVPFIRTQCCPFQEHTADPTEGLVQRGAPGLQFFHLLHGLLQLICGK